MQNRRRMLEAARDRFTDPGFGAATMEQIATQAGVAVQTLYYTFRTKGQLLAAVIEFVASGEVDAAPIIERPWYREALESTSPSRIIELIVTNGSAIYAGVAPLAEAIRAGQRDSAFSVYWNSVNSGRKAGMGRMMSRLAELDALKIDPARATDIFSVVHSHETYRGLVLESGWTHTEYQDWAQHLLRSQLLRDETA